MKKSLNINWLKRYGREFLLLVALALCEIFVKYPAADRIRPENLKNLLRYLPESWDRIGQIFLLGFPPGEGEVFYRPLQYYFFPFLYDKVFGMNSLVWLLANLGISSLGLFLFFLLVWKISRSRVAAWFGALFLISFYAPSFIAIECFQYSPETLYMVFYLFAMLVWMDYLETQREGWRVLAILAFVLGLLSSEMVLLLPVMLTAITFILKPEYLIGLWKSFVGLFLLRSPNENTRKLVSGLFPFLVLWIAYFIWRLALNFYWSNFSFFRMIGCFTLNLYKIWFNFLNILLDLTQLPGLFICDPAGDMNFIQTPPPGYQHFPAHYLAMLALIGIAAIVFFWQIIRECNRTMLLGICLCVINVAPFLFWRMPYTRTLALFSMIGIAMMFGEAMRVMCRAMYKSKHYPAEARKQLASPVFYLVMLPLSAILIYNLCYLRWS